MRRIDSLRDKLRRQSSTGKRTASDEREATTTEAAAATAEEKKRQIQTAREHRRAQRRRLRDRSSSTSTTNMGKPERDEVDEAGVPNQRDRRVPALVRSLSKDIDLDEQRRRADEQQQIENDGDADDDDDDNDTDMMKSASDGDDTKEAMVIVPPVKIRSVGSTTSEGSTGHANEDRVLVRSSDAFHVFAVMDGHGGHKAADFLVDKLFDTLDSVYTQHGGFGNKFEIEAAIDALDKTYLAMAARAMDDSGACFNAVVLYWDSDAQCHQRMVLNCGDCRSIAREAPEKPAGTKFRGIDKSRSSNWHCNDDRASTPVISLSEDHSVSNRSEKMRVLVAGAYIRNSRIAGILEPFRSIGDLDMKGASMRGWVIPTPEIREDELMVGRTTLVIATDGVWSVMSNQRAMMVAIQELSDGGDAQTAAEAIADEAREIGSSDDITVVVVSV